MSKNLEFFLVRHGESAGNVDKKVHLTHADHAIPLSEKGRGQAFQAGVGLGRHFLKTIDPDFPEKIRMWVSPYLRTQQTADELHLGIERVLAGTGVTVDIDRREHINLVEQQFGLFDGIPDEDLAKTFPLEYAHYKKQEDFEGRFWAQMPMGESRYDVALRVHQAFGTFHRDNERHGINKCIIVSHGVTLRAFVMQWLHLSPQWFEKERNPKNASIRHIEDYTDKGYMTFP
jgi:broad specificity phosphatase PhoE